MIGLTKYNSESKVSLGGKAKTKTISALSKMAGEELLSQFLCA